MMTINFLISPVVAGVLASTRVSLPLLVSHRIHLLSTPSTTKGIVSYFGNGLGQLTFLVLIYYGPTSFLRSWYSVEPILSFGAIAWSLQLLIRSEQGIITDWNRLRPSHKQVFIWGFLLMLINPVSTSQFTDVLIDLSFKQNFYDFWVFLTLFTISYVTGAILIGRFLSLVVSTYIWWTAPPYAREYWYGSNADRSRRLPFIRSGLIRFNRLWGVLAWAVALSTLATHSGLGYTPSPIFDFISESSQTKKSYDFGDRFSSRLSIDANFNSHGFARYFDHLQNYSDLVDEETYLPFADYPIKAFQRDIFDEKGGRTLSKSEQRSATSRYNSFALNRLQAHLQRFLVFAKQRCNNNLLVSNPEKEGKLTCSKTQPLEVNR
jgi:hypothetical protein